MWRCDFPQQSNGWQPENTHKIIHSAPELGHNLAPASAAPIIHSSVPRVASRNPRKHTPAHRHAQVSAHAQQWSQGRAELWTRSSSAVGWPRAQTSILIVAKAFLRLSSPVGTVLGDSSRQSVFRPEPGRGHLGESPRGWGVRSRLQPHLYAGREKMVQSH